MFQSLQRLVPLITPTTSIRSYSSFFSKHTGKQLWKSVTNVSAAGSKKGRSRGTSRIKIKDFNKGQVIGTGIKNFRWPGLNAPVIEQNRQLPLKELPEDKDYFTKLITVRNILDTFSRKKMHPLDRGFRGTLAAGQWFRGSEVFDNPKLKNFHCSVIQIKSFLLMRNKRGKFKRVKVISVVGNRNGCAGFGIGRSSLLKNAIRRSFISASRNLLAINLCDGHTIFHDFYSRYGVQKLFAHKMPPGFGIVGSRAVRSLCIAFGIKDISCKIYGSTRNYLNICRAFIIGLKYQKNYQTIADERKLHLVEFRAENSWYPQLLASPSDGQVRKREEIKAEEPSDFHSYIYDGKIRELIPKKYPFYTRTINYVKYLRDYHYRRTRQNVRVFLKAKYGAVESFLNIREKEEREKRKKEINAVSN